MTLVVAHRGLGFGAPEHSLDGYNRSLEAGADGFEVDVHISRDGQLFCVHDSNLRRTHSLKHKISSLSYDELVELGLTPLWQALAVIKDFTAPKGILIETKHPVAAGGLVEHRLRTDLDFYGLSSSAPDLHLARKGEQQKKPWVMPMSFSLLALRRLALVLPQLVSVQLLNHAWSFRLLDAVVPASCQLGPSISLAKVLPHIFEPGSFSKRGKFIWTVDEPQDLRKCFDAGVTCVITDDAALALQIRAHAKSA